MKTRTLPLRELALNGRTHATWGAAHKTMTSRFANHVCRPGTPPALMGYTADFGDGIVMTGRIACGNRCVTDGRQVDELVLEDITRRAHGAHGMADPMDAHDARGTLERLEAYEELLVAA